VPVSPPGIPPRITPRKRLSAHPRRLAAIALGIISSIASAACTAHGTAAPPHALHPKPQPSRAPQRTATLEITPAAYQLPSGISREVVLADGRNLLIIGGLNQQSVTTRTVTRLNPVTGRTFPAGRLADPTHDAAGAVLGGTPYVFGGGAAASIADIQALPGRRAGSVAGQLPRARSDLSSVTLANTAYLIGGYDGATYDPRVLATSDGRRFRTVASLPVPVRYAAVAGAGNRIWVFGGETPAGLTRVIQQVNLTTGRAAVVGRLPSPLFGATGLTLGGQIFVAGGQTAQQGNTAQLRTVRRVLAYNPGSRRVSLAGELPVRLANAAAAVLGNTGFLVGGNDGQRQVPAVIRLRLVPGPAGVGGTGSPTGSGEGLGAGTGAGVAPGSNARVLAAPSAPGGAPPATTENLAGGLLAGAPWLGHPLSRAHLAPGSDPSVLPGDVLIADDWNNRLLIVDPRGRIRWEFPRHGDLAPGQSFQLPDDAFFSPDGRKIIATEEEDSVISVISVARHAIVYRYGTPGVPGSTDNHVSNPDDAMMMPGGGLISADIKNCRVLLLAPPAQRLHHPRQVIGTTGACGHNPPQQFGSPNGAFPATDGSYLVTEINGDWVDDISLNGHLHWATHPPGVAYPSDTNEVYPGRYLTVDYSPAGQVVEFDSHGRLLWRFGGLNHPSLALPLPNGDILVNDDYNDRVIVIDPTVNRIVWQYGHTGVASTAPGYLNDPDGVDLTPPDSMLIAHAPTMGTP
jgi:hypothetical protein